MIYDVIQNFCLCPSLQVFFELFSSVYVLLIAPFSTTKCSRRRVRRVLIAAVGVVDIALSIRQARKSLIIFSRLFQVLVTVTIKI